MIISGFPGTGKSTVMNIFKGVVDLESTPFKKNWQIYADVAEHMHKQGYTVMVSSHKEMRDELLSRGVNFVAVIPKKENKDLYIERYRERGNTEEFIKLLDENFDSWIDEILEDERLVICELDGNQFISDLVASFSSFSENEDYELVPAEEGVDHADDAVFEYNDDAVDEIISHWQDTLLEMHKKKSFDELTKEELEAELEEVEGTLEICKLASDELGIKCNNKYGDMLKARIASM